MRVGAILAAVLAHPAGAEPVFIDRSTGLPVPHVYGGGWEHFVGGGVAVFDCNADGRPDIFAAGGEQPARLFVNTTEGQGKPLRFATGDIPDLRHVVGAYPLDIDGDGALDLGVLRVGRDLLLRGGPDCAFEDASASWGFHPRAAWTTAFAATWQRDESLPVLAFGHYVDRTDPEGPFGACDTSDLYRPMGRAYGQPELIAPGFCALSMLISDWRRTGEPELRISNDRHYYVRGGYEQMFRLNPLRERTGDWPRVSLWGMGIASQDLTGDGLPEVMLTSMGDQLLQFNTGAGFSSAPYSIGTYAQRPFVGDDGRPSTGWHAEFGDIDNDGRMDLFIAKGNVDQMPSNAMRDPNNLLMQQPDGTFAEMAGAAGIATTERSRGAAMADFDGDGRLDLVVVNRRAPMELWQNATPDTGHWAAIAPRMEGHTRRRRLGGVARRRQGHGARGDGRRWPRRRAGGAAAFRPRSADAGGAARDLARWGRIGMDPHPGRSRDHHPPRPATAREDQAYGPSNSARPSGRTVVTRSAGKMPFDPAHCRWREIACHSDPGPNHGQSGRPVNSTWARAHGATARVELCRCKGTVCGMRKIIGAAAILLSLAACQPRGEIVLDRAAAQVGAVETVFIGTTRGEVPDSGVEFGRARSDVTRYVRLDVSVPPKRAPGTIRFTPPHQRPDPLTDFVTTQEIIFPSAHTFRGDLSKAIARERRGRREAVVFVHGFNSTFAEGAYRLAQLGHDLDLNGALVHYSWPSRAHALGYAYDRDSALFARDGFEELLKQVDAAGAERVLIVAHSMGAALTMETLRQIAIARERRILNRIEAVVLISPDIDVDVFRAQARRVGPLANPIIIFTSRKDRALALSARLTGQADRLGNLTDVSELGDLDVVLLDTTAFSIGAGHFNVGNSPALLALLGRIGDVDSVLAAEQSARTGLLPGAVLTVQGATQIVLSPVAAISGLEP